MVQHGSQILEALVMVTIGRQRVEITRPTEVPRSYGKDGVHERPARTSALGNNQLKVTRWIT